MSGIFKLGGRDFLNSLITSICVAGVIDLGAIVKEPNFSVFSADWALILRTMLDVGFVTFIGSLANKFLTDKNGKLMGRI